MTNSCYEFELSLILIFNFYAISNFNRYLEVSESKWINPTLNNIGVNSLRLGGLHLKSFKSWKLKLLLEIRIIEDDKNKVGGIIQESQRSKNWKCFQKLYCSNYQNFKNKNDM